MNFEETIADKLTRQSEHHRLLIVAKDEKIAELEKQSHKLQEQNEKLQLELQNFKTLYIEQAKTMGKLLTGFLQLEATFGEVLHDHSTRRKEHQQREEAAKKAAEAQAPPTPKTTRTLPPLRRQ